MPRETKKEVVRNTYRMSVELDQEVDRAARRAGLSKNDWLISAVRMHLSEQAEQRLEHDYMARHTQQLVTLAERLGLFAETQLVFAQMLLSLLPEYSDVQQARLSHVGKLRYGLLLDQVIAGVSKGKRVFLDDLERKIFKAQDWESAQGKEQK
jgi:hypothetical protein